MTDEADHLTELRAALVGIDAEAGRDPALNRAVKVLLKVAIAHHEASQISPVQQAIEHPPGFMEVGEATNLPGAD